MSDKWFKLASSEVLEKTGSNQEQGLTEAEAKRRLAEFGPNKLSEQKPPSLILLFLGQFKNFIVWVLIAAVIISGVLAEWEDSIAILVIIILNALLGFIQEWRAEKSLSALKKLSAPVSRVIRDGALKLIPAEEVVSGDIVEIEAGDYIPADVRLLTVSRFAIQESALTGESMPVNKHIEKIEQEETAIGDRKNMAFMGTIAISGRARAIAIGTGMNTELGKIAKLLHQKEETLTPLQERLNEFGKKLVYFCLGVVGLVFIMELMRGEELLPTFMIAVSLAVAAIPEGLPAIVTIALAMGVRRMVKRNALIRKLHSVETLGCTSVICSDKTGTLTQNEMTVRKIYCDGTEIDVSGSGYKPEGIFSQNPDDLNLFLKTALLCNTASLKNEKNNWKIIGDPTEGALLAMAGKNKISKEELLKDYSLLFDLPFD